ncbi:MAG: low molecular weight protein-tyrosine-phosphatase [Brooklawnia sp.]|jgi:protein-tyrosine phosphatase
MTKRILFVCWGNICRSPMGEQVARDWFERAGLDVEVGSSGVSAEESGNRIDSRAARILRAHGYEVGPHRAQQITAADIEAADMVLGFEPLHVSRMRRIAPDAENLHLVTDFDPDAVPGSGIEDPWYGPASGFDDTLADIEAAMPGIIQAVRELQ